MIGCKAGDSKIAEVEPDPVCNCSPPASKPLPETEKTVVLKLASQLHELLEVLKPIAGENALERGQVFSEIEENCYIKVDGEVPGKNRVIKKWLARSKFQKFCPLKFSDVWDLKFKAEEEKQIGYRTTRLNLESETLIEKAGLKSINLVGPHIHRKELIQAEATKTERVTTKESREGVIEFNDHKATSVLLIWEDDILVKKNDGAPIEFQQISKKMTYVFDLSFSVAVFQWGLSVDKDGKESIFCTLNTENIAESQLCQNIYQSRPKSRDNF